MTRRIEPPIGGIAVIGWGQVCEITLTHNSIPIYNKRHASHHMGTYRRSKCQDTYDEGHQSGYSSLAGPRDACPRLFLIISSRPHLSPSPPHIELPSACVYTSIKMYIRASLQGTYGVWRIKYRVLKDQKYGYCGCHYSVTITV